MLSISFIKKLWIFDFLIKKLKGCPNKYLKQQLKKQKHKFYQFNKKNNHMLINLIVNNFLICLNFNVCMLTFVCNNNIHKRIS